MLRRQLVTRGVCGENGFMTVNGLKFTAVYEECEEGGYVGSVVEIPGAITQGEMLEETRANLKEAAQMMLDYYLDKAGK